MEADIQWDANGLPRSVLFDDKYFCQENGLLESRYVFCGGNQLKARWEKLPAQHPGTFIIAETGFGSGLNFLCAWQLWQECAPGNWTLQYVSLDQYPLSAQDLSKALELWPTLNVYARRLVKQYLPIGNTCQQTCFDEGAVKLTLIFDDVLKALDQIRDKRYSVDAWFLDGFAPLKNPQMWSEGVFGRMAALSHSGTTLSTFTAAGIARRGLNRQGFVTTKFKGFGRKRHMLKGVFSRREDEILTSKG